MSSNHSRTGKSATPVGYTSLSGPFPGGLLEQRPEADGDRIEAVQPIKKENGFEKPQSRFYRDQPKHETAQISELKTIESAAGYGCRERQSRRSSVIRIRPLPPGNR
jgi:hypothetical protein